MVARKTIGVRFEFGDRVQDRVTGFQGIVTGFITYITGCDQYLVNPPAKDGAYIDGQWLDDVRLNLVETDAISPRKADRLKGAGPEGPPRRT